MKTTNEILRFYNKANEKDRIVIFAIFLIISQGTERDKNWLDSIVYSNEPRETVIEEVYNRYYWKVQDYLAQETSC